MNRREALRLLLAGTVVTAGGIELLDFLKPRKTYSLPGRAGLYVADDYYQIQWPAKVREFDNIINYRGHPYIPANHMHLKEMLSAEQVSHEIQYGIVTPLRNKIPRANKNVKATWREITAL